MTNTVSQTPEIIVHVLAITGNTYPARMAIKRAVGGPKNTHFAKEPEPTWFVPLALAETVAAVIAQYNLETEETTLDFDPFRELSREELQERRAEIRNRKAERLEARAHTRRRKASNLDADVESGSNGHDYAFWTQPAMSHNSTVRAFENHRERLRGKMRKAGGLRSEATELERRAQSLRATPAVKGDAERARQQYREKQDQIITVGSPVIRPGWAVSDGYVIKVNRKTYTVEWQGGGTYAVDKTFVEFDPSREPRKQRAAFGFKKGGIVGVVTHLGRTRTVAEITRVNRNTVSFRYFWPAIDDWHHGKAPRGDISEATEDERAAFIETKAGRDPDAPVIWLDRFREVCGKGRALRFKSKRLDAFSISAVIQLYDGLNDENQAKFREKTNNDPLAMIALAWEVIGQQERS